MSTMQFQPGVTPVKTSARPDMSSAETQQWRQLIQERCGLHFSDGRLYFMRQRLWERMKATGQDSYAAYYNSVVYGPRGQKEWLKLVETLLNHESRFFRHEPSYAALANYVVPKLLETQRHKPKPSIMAWSAGSSQGQESYSLGMVLHNALSVLGWDVNVLGTDLSQPCLRWAREGCYSKQLIDTIPLKYHAAYVRKLSDHPKKGYEIVSWLRALVRFHTLNLCESNVGYPSDQDIIFCQNVLIYFNREDKLKVVKRLSNALKTGGYLFLGPAELTGLELDNLEPIRLPDTLIYRKI